MAWSVVGMVLAAAFCHASWNAILKSQPALFAGMTAHLFAVFVFCAVAAFYLGPPPRVAWVWLAVGQVAHFGYYCFLVAAYRRGDMSLTYPVLRGAAPPLAAFLGFLFLDELPSALAIGGIGVVSAGILLMAWTKHFSRQALAFALATSVCIASYSVIDATGARVSGDSTQYAVWLLMLDSLCFMSLLFFASRRRELSELPPRYWLRGAVGGALSVVSYALVLHAYTVAPIGTVAALRETSVLFAALFGMFWLGEAVSKTRFLGAGVIFLGVVLIVI